MGRTVTTPAAGRYEVKAMRGAFFSLDGLDGAGKSTQLALLADWLARQGFDVVRCREPGGTPIGEEIRRLLLDERLSISPVAETLLYMASRAQLVADVIRPALEAGRVVLCDRFLLSTLAYQGYASGVDIESIRRMGDLATGGIVPDWVGVLDLEHSAAEHRRRQPADRIEQRSADFHRKVREGYLAEARRDPERITVINAAGDPQSVHARIVSEAQRVLDAACRP